ncbi:MAG: histidine kinase [Lachnospiraceae bacterium]|nr:histidine kinase [Lachnospiraceae bacterium]
MGSDGLSRLFGSIGGIVCLILIAVIILLYVNTRKMARLITSKDSRMERQMGYIEKKDAAIRNLQTSIALSQIKPHFLYNALNSIYVLCGKDLAKGRQAISDLSDYLRINIGSIDSREPIAFEKELEHVKKYLALEELRFPDEFTVSILTPVTDFTLPALTLQPIVENAVRHGVVPKGGGGIILITTRETRTHIVISVSDNGSGYELKPEETETDPSKHVGIRNVRERLQRMCDGELEINSTIGYGTEAVIRIPKQRLR